MPLNNPFRGIFLAQRSGKVKRTKDMQNFLEMCLQCLSTKGVNELVQKSDYDRQLSFHKVHLRFIEIARQRNDHRTADILDDRHPFVKVGGKWHISNVKLYLYLVAARPLLAKIGNPDLTAIYEAVQASQSYIKRAKELDKQLSPNTWVSYEDYQIRLQQLYEEHLIEQGSILDRIENVRKGDPVL